MSVGALARFFFANYVFYGTVMNDPRGKGGGRFSFTCSPPIGWVLEWVYQGFDEGLPVGISDILRAMIHDSLSPDPL
jgi:hypothetical protein